LIPNKEKQYSCIVPEKETHMLLVYIVNAIR